MKKSSIFAMLVLALLVLDMVALAFVNETNETSEEMTTTTMAILSGSVIAASTSVSMNTTDKVSYSNDINNYDIEGRLRLLEIGSQKDSAAMQQQLEDVRLETETQKLSGNDVQAIEDEIARLDRQSEQEKSTTTTLPCPY